MLFMRAACFHGFLYYILSASGLNANEEDSQSNPSDCVLEHPRSFCLNHAIWKLNKSLGQYSDFGRVTCSGDKATDSGLVTCAPTKFPIQIWAILFQYTPWLAAVFNSSHSSFNCWNERIGWMLVSWRCLADTKCCDEPIFRLLLGSFCSASHCHCPPNVGKENGISTFYSTCS